MRTVIGVDEVGRGPLAGPLTVCALRLTEQSSFFRMEFFKDSKKLSSAGREDLFARIVEEAEKGCLDYAVSNVTPRLIDKLGMRRALALSVTRALSRVGAGKSETILLDGSLSAPKEYQRQKTLIKGDEKEIAIALASVVAKVTRDRAMLRLSKKFPGYGFERHKGYGTEDHRRAIRELGACDIHRRTFCQNILGEQVGRKTLE